MSSKSSTRHSTFLVLAAIIFVAANLRAPVTGVPPVIDQLQQRFAISASSGGLLVAIPLLAFGLLSPLAPRVSHRLGLERTLIGALFLISVGLVLRSSNSEIGLFAGTTVIGIGIAMGNVLMPSAVKRYFQHQQIASVTGYAALSMGIVAALSSAIVVPIADGAGWQLALLTPLVFSLLGMLLWWPLKQNGGDTPVSSEHSREPVSLWRSPLAWQVTLFMGINSLLYYLLITWLPTILSDNGLSLVEAGNYHGIMQLASALPGLLLSPVVRRLKDQRWLAAILSLLMTLGFLGLHYSPSLSAIWSIALGFGSGGIILLSFIYMSLRTSSAHQAALLSGMAQCVGYLLAAVGPVLVGSLHDYLGNWTLILWAAAVVSLVMLIFGVLGGRNRSVDDR